MDLKSTQLKDTYGNLLTIGETEGSPTTGTLENGDGEDITALNVAGTITGVTLTGTLSTAAQTNITSVGTLTSLSSTGNINADDYSVGSWKTIDWTGSLVKFGGIDAANWTAISLHTSGSEKVRIDTSGNVGIGTDSPTRTLQVHEGSATSSGIKISNSTTGATIDDGFDLVVDSVGNAYMAQKEALPLIFLTSDTERMRIHSDGDISFRDGSASEAFYWDASAGSLGIGTTSPDAPLSIDTGTTGTLAQFRGANTDLLNIDGDSDAIVLDARNVAYLGFEIQGSEKMRIDTDGNVGINNTSPSSFLPNGRELVLGNGSGSHGMTIFSDSAGTGNLFFADGTTGDEAYRGFLRYAHSSDNMEFYTAGSNLRMTIDSSGNVGIGVSPSTALDILGDLTVRRAAASTQYTQIQSGGGESKIIAKNGAAASYQALVFESGNNTTTTERMRIDSSGNVGIGGTATDFASNRKTLEVKSGQGAYILASDITNSAYCQIAAEASVGYVGMRTNHPLAIVTNNLEKMRIDSSGNLLIGTTATPTASAGNIVLKNGTAPTGNATDGVILYAEDVSTSSELKVRDEAGNVTTLSPHNFSLIPDGASEPMAWAYYSERDGKKINVDMLKLARMVESLTGEKLVYEQ